MIESEYRKNHFEAEIELPFGTISSVLKYKEEANDDHKFHEITQPTISAAYKWYLEPSPISIAE